MAILILTEQDLAELTKKFGDFYDKLTLSVLSRASPQMKKELEEWCRRFQRQTSNMMDHNETMASLSLQ